MQVMYLRLLSYQWAARASPQLSTDTGNPLQSVVFRSPGLCSHFPCHAEWLTWGCGKGSVVGVSGWLLPPQQWGQAMVTADRWTPEMFTPDSLTAGLNGDWGNPLLLLAVPTAEGNRLSAHTEGPHFPDSAWDQQHQPMSSGGSSQAKIKQIQVRRHGSSDPVASLMNKCQLGWGSVLWEDPSWERLRAEAKHGATSGMLIRKVLQGSN